MCQRCVRFCNEVVQDEGLVIEERGVHAQIATYMDKPYTSQFSGNTVEMCPVGALTARTYRFKARPWELRHTPSVCPHCSVGCNIEIDNRLGREVVRFMSRTNDEVDDGWLCDKGRYGYGFIHNPQRLQTPLIRKNGKLEPATWDEAFEFLVNKTRAIRTTHGLNSIGAITGNHATNEEIYIFQKFAREVLGTNNVAHFDGNLPANAAELTSATIGGLEQAKVVVVVGADITQRQPVMELRLKKAHKQGTKLIFIGGNPNALSRFATIKISDTHQNLPELLNDLIASLTKEGEATTDIEKVAQLLKSADTSAVWLVELATLNSPELFGAALKLVEATGQANKAGLGLGILSTANNTTGARDIAGAFKNGLSFSEMFSGDAGLKAMFIMGANPLAELEIVNGNPKSLTDLEFLVVTAMFLSPTAELAHVVLPTASFAEKEGTFTNTEGRVQKILATMPPVRGTAPELAIWLELANRLGQPLPKMGIVEIFGEICQNVPGYNGLNYAILGDNGQLRGGARKKEAFEV
jgi:NADH-quinone oxidoreductase subunit G